MGSSSSDAGSVPVPSKDPNELRAWEQARWQARYELDPEAGAEEAGGYGVVFLVRDRVTSNPYALKQPRYEDRAHRTRFRREIVQQQALHHRHVMPIVDHDPDFAWFVMPRASRTLKDAAPEMSDDDIGRVLLHAAKGLHAAHDRGLVHRDVKPWNILELVDEDTEEPYWVVADFGLVRRPPGVSTDIRTTHVLGTEGFVAPEVLSANRVTPLADVYSLGRMLAWMVTGVAPNALAPLHAPGPWDALERRMTSDSPDHRPQTMLDVIDGVNAVLDGLRAERAKRWAAGTGVGSWMDEKEEQLLAVMFHLLPEPGGPHDQPGTSLETLTDYFSSKAYVRSVLQRLIELGFVRQGMSQEEHEYRIYIPNPEAWTWLAAHRDRIDSLIPEPRRQRGRRGYADVQPASDPDIPF